MTEELKKSLDKIEPEIAEALKPVFDRPRIFPAPVRSPVDDESQKWREEWPNKPAGQPFEPVRTITQFLVDIEKIADRLTIRQEDAEKNLAVILKSIDERLSRIENSLGGC